MTRISTRELDDVLAIQLAVAWAGEAAGDPPRFGWWSTDLIDAAGGGDFMQRLAPRTAAWASLEAAREAARRTDARATAYAGDPDALRTVFQLGPALDERLDERLADLKRGGEAPRDALPGLPDLDAFDADEVRMHLGGGASAYEITPDGRALPAIRNEPPSPLVRRLAGALFPVDDAWPAPHVVLRR